MAAPYLTLAISSDIVGFTLLILNEHQTLSNYVTADILI